METGSRPCTTPVTARQNRPATATTPSRGSNRAGPTITPNHTTPWTTPTTWWQQGGRWTSTRTCAHALESPVNGESTADKYTCPTVSQSTTISTITRSIMSSISAEFARCLVSQPTTPTLVPRPRPPTPPRTRRTTPTRSRQTTPTRRRTERPHPHQPGGGTAHGLAPPPRKYA